MGIGVIACGRNHAAPAITRLAEKPITMDQLVSPAPEFIGQEFVVCRRGRSLVSRCSCFSGGVHGGRENVFFRVLGSPLLAPCSWLAPRSWSASTTRKRCCRSCRRTTPRVARALPCREGEMIVGFFMGGEMIAGEGMRTLLGEDTSVFDSVPTIWKKSRRFGDWTNQDVIVGIGVIACRGDHAAGHPRGVLPRSIEQPLHPSPDLPVVGNTICKRLAVPRPRRRPDEFDRRQYTAHVVHTVR